MPASYSVGGGPSTGYTRVMSDAARQSRLAVAEDLVGLPEHPRAEIIRGAIEYKASPSFEHADAQSTFGEWLKGPYQRGRGGPGGWWIGTEVEIELESHEVYLPDVAGWRKDRVPERPRGRPIRVRPDWVCEILSPSTARRDVGPKLVTYHRAGVGHYWVVDPQYETMTVYRATADGFVVHATASRADRGRFPPFADIELFVGELFGD